MSHFILSFPEDFIFGTSTAAAQIETAFDHDWQGVKARDGRLFERTTDHELQFASDARLIASLAPSYRMSLLWSKLQREPLADFDESTALEYHSFFNELKKHHISIMMVLHHFTNPIWFAKSGGWESEGNIRYWVDFSKKVVDEFGSHISLWNTFNEPNVYASNGWLTRYFPPFKFNPLASVKVIKNMAKAHDIVYDYIKQKFPHHPVGVSHNAAIFSAENFLGILPAKLTDWWFMDYIGEHFNKADFFGMSYYGRIPHDPLPVTYLEHPEKMKKLQKRHDDIWEYYPEGLGICLKRYWEKYKKPIIITENGVCDETDFLRMQAIQDYSMVIHKALQDGIPVKGYYWWSTWDNFEWHLGPSMRFGLYECDFETMKRTLRPSGERYQQLAYSKVIHINS